MNQTIIDGKKAVVAEIAEKMRESQSAVVVEYRGLTVKEVTELRRELRAEEVEFKVYKNSLAQRAAEEVGYAELTETLTGPNAIAFGKDAVAPARVLAKFAKKHDKLVITALSKLPNREGMISMLLGCLQSPVRSFACAVKAVADQKGETAESAE